MIAICVCVSWPVFITIVTSTCWWVVAFWWWESFLRWYFGDSSLTDLTDIAVRLITEKENLEMCHRQYLNSLRVER